MVDLMTLPKGTPETIIAGMQWLEPIEKIIHKHHSVDCAVPDNYYDDESGPGWFDGREYNEAYPNGYKIVRRKHYGRTWQELLADKRSDSHYPDVVQSIRENGWVRPVTVQIEDEQADIDGNVVPAGFRYGDGHHRLAAAIDLGFTHIPVEAVSSMNECISADSGDWEGGMSIPTDNNNGPADW